MLQHTEFANIEYFNNLKSGDPLLIKKVFLENRPYFTYVVSQKCHCSFEDAASIYPISFGETNLFVRKYNLDADSDANFFSILCKIGIRIFYRERGKKFISNEDDAESIYMESDGSFTGLIKWDEMDAKKRATNRRSKREVSWEDLEILPDNIQKDLVLHLEERLIGKEVSDFVSQLLDQLGGPCKTLLEERFFNNLSFKELASELGIEKEGTVRQQKKRCLEKLRKLIMDSPKFLQFAKELNYGKEI